MLKIVNTLSIINMIAAARKLNDSATNASEETIRTAEYLQWASKFSKHFTTKGDFNGRQHNYEESEAYIKRCNEKADASGNANAMRCGHNKFSDWSRDEFKQFVSGIQIEESEMVERRAIAPT